jgi:RimJ/RimL family protein N-acetyltransferase
MPKLATERLDLLPLSPIQLQLYLEEPARLEQELGIPISRAVITERVRRAIRMKLAKMAHIEQAQLAWYTYWLLIIRAVPVGAGLAGFKGLPDQDGQVEIGYGIDPDYQGQGYMTEAVQHLIAWAFEEASCLSVVARDTKKWNVASQRVLAQVGLQVYEESEDAFCLRVERTDFRAEQSPRPPRHR